MDSEKAKDGYFSPEGWTGVICLNRRMKSSFWAQAVWRRLAQRWRVAALESRLRKHDSAQPIRPSVRGPISSMVA
jgi:hypothetical protein